MSIDLLGQVLIPNIQVKCVTRCRVYSWLACCQLPDVEASCDVKLRGLGLGERWPTHISAADAESQLGVRRWRGGRGAGGQGEGSTKCLVLASEVAGRRGKG